MSRTKLRDDEEITGIFKRHGQVVYRICFAYMKNHADAEDALQQTFFKLIEKRPVLTSEEHEKAWLMRTAANICKNALRYWWRKRQDIDDMHDLATNIEDDTVLQEVLKLPEKYKIVVYLYYYEGYNNVEIADILKKPPSTIRNHLREARSILRERLGDDFDEE